MDENYEDIRGEIADHGDVASVDMARLRDVHGAGKLGKHVRANISKELRSHGIGHYPPELPIYQHEVVRLYLIGTPAGDLIEAVLNVSADADGAIRNAVQNDSAAIVEKIRELVCD